MAEETQKIIISIPAKLFKYMVEGGWNKEQYVKQVLIDPLIERYRNEKKGEIMTKEIAEVDESVREIKSGVKIEAVSEAEPATEPTALTKL